MNIIHYSDFIEYVGVGSLYVYLIVYLYYIYVKFQRLLQDVRLKALSLVVTDCTSRSDSDFLPIIEMVVNVS